MDSEQSKPVSHILLTFSNILADVKYELKGGFRVLFPW